ncbi:MAG: ribosome small subunit-dependent GTPase A [Proteobacteria bacterium]|nr:ribosome small subunit-dependent GTPase A [Pseudomonadota bacterium]
MRLRAPESGRCAAFHRWDSAAVGTPHPSSVAWRTADGTRLARKESGDNPPVAKVESPTDPVRIGWRGALPPLHGTQRLARVSAQHRAGYEVHDGARAFNAQPAPRFLKRGIDPAERPAVGDFVIIDLPTEAGDAPPHIVEVLPRRGALTRAAAGERYGRQVIAANIDVVLVLMGLDGRPNSRSINPARAERYLALIEGSHAQAVIVLTKSDKVEAEWVDEALQQLAARLPAGTPLHAINGKDACSVAVLDGYLKPGVTAVLVGSSGAGKSTLTNTLLGEARMATAATRASDDRGRHTTTHRALLLLPSGACLIDTPGMRELKLTGEEGLDVFADIDALATRCRFADCGHGNEPGCAVRAAIDAGELDAARFTHYLKLDSERGQQTEALEAQLHRKAQAKVQTRALRQLYRDRERK